MTVVPVGRRYAVRVELRFAASDSHGATSGIPVLPLTLSYAHPPTPGGFVRHEVKVELQGRANHLVVAADDPLSDKVATAERDLTLP